MTINTNALWFKAYQFVLDKIIVPINWNWFDKLLHKGKSYDLTESDHEYLRKALAKNYYVIATRRENELATYAIALGNFFVTGRFSYYNHVLMNIEGDDPVSDEDFRLMEATQPGVHWSTFMEVFNCDSVALLRPKNITIEEWEEVVEEMKLQLGKEYDDAIDFSQTERASCVQMVHNSLSGMNGYKDKFGNLEALLKKHGRLSPQMFYNCDDFEVVWEVRR